MGDRVPAGADEVVHGDIAGVVAVSDRDDAGRQPSNRTVDDAWWGVEALGGGEGEADALSVEDRLQVLVGRADDRTDQRGPAAAFVDGQPPVAPGGGAARGDERFVEEVLDGQVGLVSERVVGGHGDASRLLEERLQAEAFGVGDRQADEGDVAGAAV